MASTAAMHHEARIHDVVAGDDARPVALGTALQDQRVQRHDEQARQTSRSSAQSSTTSQPPSARKRVQLTIGRARGMHAGMFEVQIEQANGHADGAQRHETDLHLVARQPFAGQRTERRADGKRRQQQRVDRLVAAEHVAGIGGQLREDQARPPARTTRCLTTTGRWRASSRRSGSTSKVEVIGLKLIFSPGSVASARGMARAHRYMTDATPPPW